MKSMRMLFVFSCVLSGICHAAEPSDSTSAAQRWVAAKFLGVKEPPGAEKSFLEAQLKPDALVRDRIEGRTLLIVQQKFDNGIAMRSPGEILVHLSSGASSFEGVVGIDSNDLGYYANTGRGSVVASIEAGESNSSSRPSCMRG